MNWDRGLTGMLGGTGLRRMHRKYFRDSNDLTRSTLKIDTVDEPTVQIALSKGRRPIGRMVLVGLGLLVIGFLILPKGPSGLGPKNSREFEKQTQSLDLASLAPKCGVSHQGIYRGCFLPELHQVLNKQKFNPNAILGMLPKGARVIAHDIKKGPPNSGPVLYDFQLLHLSFTLLAHLKSQQVSYGEMELLADIAQLLLEKIQGQISKLPAGGERDSLAAQIVAYNETYKNHWAKYQSPDGPGHAKPALQELSLNRRS